jgi:hypothetical protein
MILFLRGKESRGKKERFFASKKRTKAATKKEKIPQAN